MVAESTETPYTAPLTVTTANCSLYSNEDTFGVPRTDSKGVNILIERIESEFDVFCNASSAIEVIITEYVLTWYKEIQIQFPMLSCLATIIFQYLPLNLKISGDYTLQGLISLLVVQGYW